MKRPFLAAMLMMAACTSEAPPNTAPPAAPSADACGAAGMQALVGQPATVLETMRFAAPVRILRPGMAVTMDYSAERLNITVNEAETITRVTCG